MKIKFVIYHIRGSSFHYISSSMLSFKLPPGLDQREKLYIIKNWTRIVNIKNDFPSKKLSINRQNETIHFIIQNFFREFLCVLANRSVTYKNHVNHLQLLSCLSKYKIESFERISSVQTRPKIPIILVRFEQEIYMVIKVNL